MVGRATAWVFANHQTPDPDPWFVKDVVDQWWQEYRDSGELDLDFAIPGSRVRASWAGMCARRIAYSVAGIEESDPTTVVDAWRFNIGSMLHEVAQKIAAEKYPGAKIELKVAVGDIGSAHVDLLVTLPDGRTVLIEIKTINGYGFKRMFGPDGEGPRFGGVVQAALAAIHMDPPPDEIVLAVFSLECISPYEAAKLGIKGEYQRFAAQYTFTREEYEPVGREEYVRLERIVELVDKNGWEFVPRIIADPNLPPHEVVLPSKGTIVIKDNAGNRLGTRTTWHCNYCNFQSQCQTFHEQEQAAKRAVAE